MRFHDDLDFADGTAPEDERWPGPDAELTALAELTETENAQLRSCVVALTRSLGVVLCLLNGTLAEGRNIDARTWPHPPYREAVALYEAMRAEYLT